MTFPGPTKCGDRAKLTFHGLTKCRDQTNFTFLGHQNAATKQVGHFLGRLNIRIKQIWQSCASASEPPQPSGLTLTLLKARASRAINWALRKFKVRPVVPEGLTIGTQGQIFGSRTTWGPNLENASGKRSARRINRRSTFP